MSFVTGRPAIGRRWLVAEALAWIGALIVLAYVSVGYIERVTGNREALRSFDAARETVLHPRSGDVDQSLWSAHRVSAWQESLALPAATPLAVLRIPRINLEVAVLEGTADATLNRAIGHIEGTAAPGSDGNAGIAGHRDGFFRGLKEIAPGDTIELETLERTESYRIEKTWIVEPDDVSVLDPTPGRTLTLVTCYPFYFVGSAPQRFIVRAVRTGLSEDARRP